MWLAGKRQGLTMKAPVLSRENKEHPGSILFEYYSVHSVPRNRIHNKENAAALPSHQGDALLGLDLRQLLVRQHLVVLHPNIVLRQEHVYGFVGVRLERCRGRRRANRGRWWQPLPVVLDLDVD